MADASHTLAALRKAADPLAALKELYARDPQAVLDARDHCGGATPLARALGIADDRAVRRMFTPGPRQAEVIAGAQTDLEERVAAILRRSRNAHHSYESLSEALDRSVSSVRVAVEGLRAQGVAIAIDDDRVSLPTTPQRRETLHIDLCDEVTDVGVVSDTHLGHREAAEPFLHWCYDHFAERGIETVLHCGDLTEGPGERGYNGHANAVWHSCQTWQGLEEYVVENYPCVDGITTYAIASSKSHCGWEYNASGIDMLSNIANGRHGLPARTDIVYRGHDITDVELGGVKFRLFHPDGGKAYALSYKLQKFVEAMPGGSKPDVFLVGHYHSYCTVRVRNVHAIMVPGMQYNSDLFVRNYIEPVVGALILRIQTDAEGSLRSMTVEDLADYYVPEVQR